MSVGLARFCQRIAFRSILLAVIVAVALLGRGSGASATTFQPTWTATLADPDPGAHSDITLRLNIPAPSANFGQLLNFIPPGITVTPGADVPNGAMAGRVNSNATLGLVNGSCSSSVSPTFEMMDASTDPGQTIPIYAGIYDYDNNGLPDNVDYYPSFLGVFAPQLEPVARLYGQTIVAGVVTPLNFVIFEPGAPIPLFPALEPSLGYPTVVIIGDPTEPIEPIPISDFCTPIETATTLRGVSADNPATSANEGGITLRRNPDQAAAMNAMIFARSRWDADSDGIENELDPCPLAADTTWDPRDPQSPGDADGDGLPDSCDPQDNEPNSDQDGDAYLNRQDPCPRLAEFFPTDTDRDGIGDSCDPAPEDPSDAGAGHRHQICLADTLIIGSPPSLDPPAFTCPDGPDLPVPPVMYVYPEQSIEAVGSVHSVHVGVSAPNNGGAAPGVEVLFDVSGVNPAVGSCLTDNSGSCTFNYLGQNTGFDTISISATVEGIAVHKEVTNEWVGRPSNDDFGQATVVTDIPFQDEISLIAANNELDEPSDCMPVGKTVWYRFTPSQATYVTIEAATNSAPIVLAAYTGTSIADLTQVACDRGVFGPPIPYIAGEAPSGDEYYFQDYVTFAAEAGVTYQVQVGMFEDFGYFPGKVDFSIVYAAPGDANCSADLSVLDALEVLRSTAGFPAAACAGNGDIDCDGAVDAVDALMILRVVAAIIEAPGACLLPQT